MLGILGWQFNISASHPTSTLEFYELAKIPGTDITNYFTHGQDIPDCTNTGNAAASAFTAVTFNPCSAGTCTAGGLTSTNYNTLGIVNSTKQVGFDWNQLASANLTNYFVIDGVVLNMDPYIQYYPTALANDALDSVIRQILNSTWAEGGRDGTKLLTRQDAFKAAVHCLTKKYRAGHIDKKSTGCFVSQIILICSLVVVLAIVLARFFMALIFSWFVSRKLSRSPPPAPSSAMAAKDETMEMATMLQQRMDSGISSTLTAAGAGTGKKVEVGNDLYTVLLITCYSENTEGIRGTVESLSMTDYPDDRKLLFLIADGIITGHGETLSTPEMCLSLITFDDESMKNPEPMEYIAVAVGAKQFNCAKVYAGHYVCKGHKVPMILVVKSGNPDEQGKPKPGNRGKRDSQLILMNFFSRVTYNDRMTPLDYDLFRKIQYLMGVTPDYFELVLMVCVLFFFFF